MTKIFSKFNLKRLEIPENWCKLPNFQLVRPLSLEQQIERFQAAGRKLEQLAGLGVYDFDSAQPIDDVLEDPTRDPDYDIIDAATTMRDLALKQQASDEPSNEVKQSSEASNDDKVSSEPKSENVETQSAETVSS